MLDKEVGEEHIILPATWTTQGNLDKLHPIPGERIERFPPGAGPKEESPQESSASESERPCIHA
jgi:hypothetical protein